MGVDHVFHAVCDDVPGGEGIEHPVVAHGNAIVYGDGVELGRKAAQFFNLRLDQLAGLVQVGVAGDKLGEGIDHGDDGFPHLVWFHACSVPEGACTGHSTAFECDAASERMLHNISQKNPPRFQTGKGVFLYCTPPYNLPGPHSTRIRTSRDRIIR